MGIEAVGMLVLTIVLVFLAGVLIFDRRDRKSAEALLVDKVNFLRESLDKAEDLNAILEQEIQRLQKNPLTQRPKAADTSVLRAKSPADVRHLTETAWGMQTEIGNEAING